MADWKIDVLELETFENRVNTCRCGKCEACETRAELSAFHSDRLKSLPEFPENLPDIPF